MRITETIYFFLIKYRKLNQGRLSKHLLSAITVCILLASSSLHAQDAADATTVNPIQQLLAERFKAISTVASFLNIAPDSKAGAMAGIGTSTATDAFSMFYNPAKMAFMERNMVFGASYTPWLASITEGIFLVSLSASSKLNNRSAWGLGIRYFNMGQIDFTDQTSQGDIQIYQTVNPKEFAIGGYYSLKLSRNFSSGVGINFIYSDITNGAEINGLLTHAGSSVGLDLSGFYSSSPMTIVYPTIVSFGVSILNIGPKITYSSEQGGNNFLPTTFKMGFSTVSSIDNENEFSFNLEILKLLVPSSPIYEYDEQTGSIKRDDDGNPIISSGKDPNVNVIQGMFQSFYDAPGGFSEEIQEFSLAFGSDYTFAKIFSARLGYYMGSIDKGYNQYFTLGAGFDFYKYVLDFAYLVPTGDSQSPLQNTLRISLQYDMFGYVRAFNFGGQKSRRRR